jgi:HEAT repeat protein
VDEQALDAAFQRLQWLVKLGDDAATVIGDRVAMRELAGDLAGVALSSLGAAATPTAQAVLTAVRADRGLDAGIREHATIATLQLAQPAPQLVEGIWRDANDDFDGRGNAMLVLGALAPRSGPLADGRTPTQALLAMELDAAARGDLPTWLLAVGNAAPPETMAVVQRHVGNPDPEVRSAALVALRRVLTEQAVSVLIQRGLGDAVASVRREALLELGRRDGAAAREAVANVAQHDPDEELRKRAEEMLRSRA